MQSPISLRRMRTRWLLTCKFSRQSTHTSPPHRWRSGVCSLHRLKSTLFRSVVLVIIFIIVHKQKVRKSHFNNTGSQANTIMSFQSQQSSMLERGEIGEREREWVGVVYQLFQSTTWYYSGVVVKCFVLAWKPVLCLSESISTRVRPWNGWLLEKDTVLVVVTHVIINT